MEEVIEYLYIMDYCNGTISKIKLVNVDDDIDVERLLLDNGFIPGVCYWMFSEENITNIKDITKD